MFYSQHLHLDVFLDSFIAISFLGADVAIGESGDVFPVAKSDADIGMCGLYDAFVVDRFAGESFLKLGFIATFSIWLTFFVGVGKGSKGSWGFIVVLRLLGTCVTVRTRSAAFWKSEAQCCNVQQSHIINFNFK